MDIKLLPPPTPPQRKHDKTKQNKKMFYIDDLNLHAKNGDDLED